MPHISKEKMLGKAVILVVILSFYVKWLNCERATVPFKVCEMYVNYPVRYTFNSTVNSTVNKSVFKDSNETLKILYEQLQAKNIVECNDPLKLMITRTMGDDSTSNTEYDIEINYNITIQVDEVYWYNYSVLNDNIQEKLRECLKKLANTEFIESFESKLSLNISGQIFKADRGQINDELENQYCDRKHYRCPIDSKEINKTCECSEGTYLDVNITTCTPCPKNTYQENTGMFNCAKCGEGLTTVNKTGIRNRTGCMPVSTSSTPTPTPTPTTITASTPPECSEGEYWNTTLKTCSQCNKNFYKNIPGNEMCTKCPNGQITSGQGATSCFKDPDPDTNVLAIALSISLLAVLIIVGIIFFVLQRRKAKQQEKQDREEFIRIFIQQQPPNRPTDSEANDYHVTPNPHFEENSEIVNDDETENDEMSNLGHLSKDVASRNLEIPRDCITLTRVRLGRGQFGEVQQVLVRKPGEPEILCAAKMARGSRVLPEDMLDELEIHLKLEDIHENVVNLLGVCSSTGGPFYLIVEYCDNGSLIDYLRKYEDPSHGYVNTADRETLSQEWKLNCTLEICNGMKYLASHKIVHRDLAARNVLLDSNTVAKISDFGMAKDVYLKSYYKQRSEGCFPLRWMAIESIKSLEFNEKTDVWSFGILVWEIFTHGNLPYYEIIDDQKVALHILSGKKLKRPQNCPKNLYNNMLRCWSTKSFNRPKFWELYKTLSETIQHQPKHGKAIQRGFSRREMMQRLSETKQGLKRKLSRKSSRQSEASIAGHTSSRKQSVDRVSNDVELNERKVQLPKNMFFNPEAENEIEVHVNAALTIENDFVEEDENQNAETLENNEKKLEPYHDDNKNLRDNPECFSKDITTHNSANTSEMASPERSKNQDIKDFPTTFDPPNNSSELGTSLPTTDSNELEEENTLSQLDDSSLKNNENNPAVIGLDMEKRPNTNDDDTNTPKNGVAQVVDLTSNNESFLATNSDDVSVDSSKTFDDTTNESPAELTDNLPNDKVGAPEKITTNPLTQETLNQNENTTEDIKDGLDSTDLKNLDDPPEKTESEDKQKSMDGGDFLDDVLHAVVNVLQKNDNEFESSPIKTEETDTVDSSSC